MSEKIGFLWAMKCAYSACDIAKKIVSQEQFVVKVLRLWQDSEIGCDQAISDEF